MSAQAQIPSWVIPVILLAMIQGVALQSAGFFVLGDSIHDPDSLMRLARIRYVLAAHSWHGGYFPRENAPYGLVMHWSMLFDLVILGLAEILRRFFAWPDALQIAGVFSGPLTFYGVLLALNWATAPILTARARLILGLIAVCQLGLHTYGAIGRADHHVFLLLLGVLLGGAIIRMWMWPNRIASSLLAGFFAALCLWASFECVMMVIPALAIAGLLWLRDGTQARLRQGLCFTALFCIGVRAAVWIDPPAAGFAAVEIDRISLPYVGLAALSFVGWVILWGRYAEGEYFFITPSPRGRLIAGVGMGLLAAIVWMLLFPEMLNGMAGIIYLPAQALWFAAVHEMQPIDSLSTFFCFIATGWLGLAMALWLLRQDWQHPRRDVWLVLSALLLPMIYEGMAHVRFALMPSIIGGAIVAYGYERLGAYSDHNFSRKVANALRVAAFMICVPGASIIGIALLMAEDLPGASEVTTAMAGQPMAPCSVYGVREALNDPAWLGMKRAIIATENDVAPALLYWTEHGTLAGPYHRNAEGLQDEMDLFRGADDAVSKAIILKRGISFLLVCAAAPHHALMSKEDGLYRRLIEGHPPVWLHAKPWPPGMISGFMLYQVEPSLFLPNLLPLEQWDVAGKQSRFHKVSSAN